MYIQGAAGSGKSTLCHYIAYHWAKGALWNASFKYLFWIPLRNLTRERYPSDKTYTSFDLIVKEYEGEIDLRAVQTCLENSDVRNQTLILLDGYDELSADAQGSTASLTKAFNKLKEVFPHLLITSRPGTCSFDHSCDLELLGFDRQGIADYIDKFFKQVQGEEKKKKLQHVLKHSPHALSLAHIPINLTLLCSLFNEDPKVFDSSESITMTFIYDRIVNQMYKWFMIRKIDQDSSKQTKEKILESTHLRSNKEVKGIAQVFEEMASIMMEQDTLYLNKEKIEERVGQFQLTLNELANCGLLRIPDEKGYFIHLTFQEFLTASRIANQYLDPEEKNRNGCRDFIRKNKFEPRYSLILRMIAGYLSIRTAASCCRPNVLQQFFNDLFAEPHDLAISHELNLFADCFEECQDPTQIKQYCGFIEVVKEYIGELSSLNLDFRLLDRREKLLNHPEVIDTIIKLLAQSRTIKGMLEILRRYEGAGQRLAPRIVKSIVNVLNKESDNDVKRSAAEALGEVAKQRGEFPKEALIRLIELIKEGDYFAKRSATEALRKVAEQRGGFPKEALIRLIELIKEGDDAVKRSAAEALRKVAEQRGEFPKEALIRLIELIKEGDNAAKRSAVEVLGEVAKQGGELAKEALIGLIELIKEGNSHAKSYAAKALGEVAKQGGELAKEALIGLVELLKEGDYFAKRYAAEALGEVGKQKGEFAKEALAILIEFLKKGDNAVKRYAVEVLREVGKQKGELAKEALAILIEFLKKGDSHVKRSAVEALREVAKQRGELPKEALDGLINPLKEGDSHVKGPAVEALGAVAKQGGELAKEALAGLIKLLKEGDYFAKIFAAEALGEVAKQGGELAKEALDGLINPLKDDDSHVKRSAVEALGAVAKQGGELAKEVLAGLIELLKKDNNNAKIYAAEALGAVAKQGVELPKEALAGLIKLLKEGNSRAKIYAAEALGAVAKQGGELTKETLASLIELLKEGDDDTKIYAAEALGAVAKQGGELTKETLASLIELLKEGDSRAKIYAAEALGAVAKQGGELTKETLASLIELLKEGDDDTKIYAATALRKINKKVLLEIGIKAIPLIVETCFFIENSFSINDQQFQISDQNKTYSSTVKTKLYYKEITESLPEVIAKWRKQLDNLGSFDKASFVEVGCLLKSFIYFFLDE